MKAHFSKLHTIVIAALVAVSCNDATNQKTQNIADTVMTKVDTAMSKLKEGAERVAADVKENLQTNADSDFVVKATVATNTELKILQAGIDKGTDKELKTHARMMMADHKKLGAKIKTYAAGKGYTLPGGDEGKAGDEIGKLDKNSKGKDWDKAWADHMVSAHDDAISMFESGERNVKDDALKAIITGALPTLRSHLDMMKQLRDKLGE